MTDNARQGWQDAQTVIQKLTAEADALKEKVTAASKKRAETAEARSHLHANTNPSDVEGAQRLVNEADADKKYALAVLEHEKARAAHTPVAHKLNSLLSAMVEAQKEHELTYAPPEPPKTRGGAYYTMSGNSVICGSGAIIGGVSGIST